MNFEIAPKSTEIKASWDDARMYCFSLNIDGKTGWRLPSKEELKSIHQSAVSDYELDLYWSSREYKDNSAWFQSFSTGGHGYTRKDDYVWVRAIRDLS